jgi:hypothetical protein
VNPKPPIALAPAANNLLIFPPEGATRHRHINAMEIARDTKLHRQASLLLWVRWVLPFSLALPVSMAAYLFIVGLSDLLLLWFVSSVALLCALAIGISQELLLGRYINLGRQWTWATATASGPGLLCLIALILPLMADILRFLIPFVDFRIGVPHDAWDWEVLSRWGWSIALATTGIAQSLVLKRYMRQPGWWVVGNIVAGVIGLLLGSFVGSLLSPEQWWPELQSDVYAPPTAWIAGTTVAAITSGACTGIAFVRLLRQRSKGGAQRRHFRLRRVPNAR